jgi:predicted SAM-dependent methyltransferase
MNKLLSSLKDPSRFAEHFSIKFLNKKINQLSEIEPFFLIKKGLEIGGPSKIFTKEGYIPIYPLVDTIDGVNFSTTTVWENTISEGKTYDFGGIAPGYQLIQDGTDLSVIKPETYDLLLSSHSLEHIANPIKALKEWLRVLKKGGVLLVILPDSRYTFDCKRPITKFEHLLQDFKDNTSEKDLTHLDEIISLHDLSYDDGIKSLEDFKKRSSDNFTNRCLHHHVFDMNLLEQVFKYLNLKIILKDVSPPFNLIIMGIK